MDDVLQCLVDQQTHVDGGSWCTTHKSVLRSDSSVCEAADLEVFAYTRDVLVDTVEFDYVEIESLKAEIDVLKTSLSAALTQHRLCADRCLSLENLLEKMLLLHKPEGHVEGLLSGIPKCVRCRQFYPCPDVALIREFLSKNS